MTSRDNSAGFAAASRPRIWPRVVALGTIIFAMTSTASAETIRISATTFVLRTAGGSSDLVGEGGAGLLQNATGSYFASVEFPTTGRVCRFNLVYRDFDSNFEITARLLKKKIAIGGTAFDAPVTMATVTTGAATASDAMLRKGTSAITEPTTPSGAFYFVRLDVPATTLQVVGVEILHKASCP